MKKDFFPSKNQIKRNLEEIKKPILECLIFYYGNEYKDIITSRFDNIEYIFYKANQKKKPIIKKILYSSYNSDEFPKDLNFYLLNKKMYENFTAQKSILINDDYTRFIFAPVGYACDSCLVHEIIHAITSEPIMTVDGVLIDKHGLCVANLDNDRYFEEAITEIEAQKIFNLFKKLYNLIFLDNYTYTSKECAYDLLKPLVMPFYEKYKNDIIHSRLTLNLNELVALFGKRIFANYSQTINNCYQEYPKPQDLIDYINIAHSQIKTLDEHCFVRKRIIEDN